MFSYRTKKAVRETNRLFTIRGTRNLRRRMIRQKAQKHDKLLNQRPRNIGHSNNFQFVRKQMVKFELAIRLLRKIIHTCVLCVMLLVCHFSCGALVYFVVVIS